MKQERSGKRRTSAFKNVIFLILVTTGLVYSLDPDTLTILHLSDTHVSYWAGCHPLLEKLQREKTTDSRSLADWFVSKPRETGADLVVHTGDMVHFYKAASGEGLFQASQIEQFASLLSDCPAPFYAVLGNHDIRSYWINEADSAALCFQLDQQPARAAWIRNLACFRDGFYSRRTYRVGETRYHLIFLDNAYDLADRASLDQAQLEWLEHELAQTRCEPVLLFMHKYLPALDYNRDGIAFSAAAASGLTDSTCASGFLRLLNTHPNIRLLLVGHGHSCKSEFLPFPSGHVILQKSTGAFVKDADNWRIVKCTEHEILIHAPGTHRIEMEISVEKKDR